MVDEPSTRHGAHGEWTLRYAAHLGYRSSATPLFLHTVGSAHPVDQIAYAAQQGFSGMQYALACSRETREHLAVARAMEHHGLETGCMLFSRFETLRTLQPGRAGPAAREAFITELRRGIDVARRGRSRQIAVLAAADPAIGVSAQHDVFRERLMEGAELAASAGICLGLEPLASVLLPPMIVQRLDDALDLIDRMQMPNVKLLFDTAHVQALEGDAAAQFERAYPYVETLQLADHPGRLEPGTGSVDFRRILGFAMAHRFSGLVELEHHWLKETSEAETSGVAALRILDQQARAMYEIGRC